MTATRLCRKQLAEVAGAFDAAVVATAGIDHFCSATPWVLPADRALMPARTSWLYALPDCGGYIALARGQHHEGWPYLQPLESAWGLACPVVGPDSGGCAAALCDLLARDGDWGLAFVAGVPESSPTFAALVDHLGHRFALHRGAPARRHRASLEGGVDGFLARRSKNLRRSMRRAGARARRDGIIVEPCAVETRDAADAAYARILAVEARSWKGRRGVGINRGEMRAFYGEMNRILVARGTQRLLFARQDERDVGYILGGVLGSTYRGLQFSFDDDYRSHSLGGLMQLAQVERLCSEGIDVYDLGTDIAYKRRWGERTLDTVTVIVRRR